MRLAGLNSNNGIVRLNVYDLNDNNETLLQFGLGLFHSGVELNGREYTFGSQGGIFTHSPKAVPSAKFRESVYIGDYKGTSKDLDRILDELRIRFSGDSYDVLQNNCNSFSEAFVQKLCNRSIPGYVNRLAGIGSFFSCLLPPGLTNGAPVDAPTGYSPAAGPSSSSASSASSTGIKPFAGKGRRLNDG